MNRHSASAVSSLCIIGIATLLVPASCRAQASSPSIASVQNAFSNSSTIAPNTWVAIKGSGLAPSGDTRIWQGSDFVSNQMPTALDGVSVTMNGENAYVYYISPVQLNILTPPDLATGAVQVKVTANGQTSTAFTVQAQTYSLGFFVFNGGPYVIGTHLNGSIVGPSTLYPGASTPAQPGEEVVLYANGFGVTSSAIAKGSAIQSGTLAVMPIIQIGGASATVLFAGLVSPGLYQFNVVVPTPAANGDNTLTAQYNGQSTQTGVLLTVQSNNPPALQSLTLSASSVAGGGTVQGTVAISAAAPTGGAVVTLSSNSSAATVPATVTVPAGATSATFTISAGTVSSNQTAAITASYGGGSAQAALTITGGTTQQQFYSFYNSAVTFTTNNQTGFCSLGVTPSAPSGSTGLISGEFTPTLTSLSPLSVSSFQVEFTAITVVGQTYTLTGIQPGALVSYMANLQGTYSPITDGSATLTLVITNNSAPLNPTGTLSGSLTLTSALGTITGTLSGLFEANVTGPGGE